MKDIWLVQIGQCEKIISGLNCRIAICELTLIALHCALLASYAESQGGLRVDNVAFVPLSITERDPSAILGTIERHCASIANLLRWRLAGESNKFDFCKSNFLLSPLVRVDYHSSNGDVANGWERRAGTASGFRADDAADLPVRLLSSTVPPAS
eukprot:03959_3